MGAESGTETTEQPSEDEKRSLSDAVSLDEKKKGSVDAAEGDAEKQSTETDESPMATNATKDLYLRWIPEESGYLVTDPTVTVNHGSLADLHADFSPCLCIADLPAQLRKVLHLMATILGCHSESFDVPNAPLGQDGVPVKTVFVRPGRWPGPGPVFGKRATSSGVTFGVACRVLPTAACPASCP